MAEGSVPPRSRASALAKARDKKLAKSSADYVRGTTVRFYDWLAGLKLGTLPEGPPIWICGDCHFGNLGPVADENRNFEIQIRDFDQAVIGNPVHDLIRLGLSLACTARGSDLPGLVTVQLLEELLDNYRQALGSESEARHAKQPDIIRCLAKEAHKATWKTLANANTDNAQPSLPLGSRFWPLSREERREIEAAVESSEIGDLARSVSGRNDDAKVRLLDAAFWRKGCSSLGRLRYAAVLQVGSDKDERHYCFLDFKEAVKAAAPHDRDARMPRRQAERVLAGARNLSPPLGERMRAITLLDRPVFVRELLPEDLKIEIGRLEQDEAKAVACYLASVVGRAHARQMDGATRRQWKTELGNGRSRIRDAPSWLWRSVIDLLVDHEKAYLEHCRTYHQMTV